MTKEEKELLLKDLCARELYHPRIQVFNQGYEGFQDGKFDTDLWLHHIDAFRFDRIEILLYLRSMSSMTEKEKEEFEKISHCFYKTIVLKRDKKGKITEQKVYFDNEIPSSGAFGDDGDYRYIKQEYFINLIDWLNAHYFDYRDLIGKGLALEALEGMYKTK